MSYASSILGLLPGGRRAPGIAQLISKIEAYLPPDQVERVREAHEYAETAHPGQKRQSARPISRTRSRSPTSWPTCTWTGRR
jgi:GTP pyrophosphokinase